MEQDVDKGRLLYQEEWAGTRRFHDRFHVVFGTILMAMTFVLAGVLGWAFISGGVTDPGMAAVMFSMVVGMLFFMSFAMLAAEFRRMPFRLYERGFTLPNVPLSKGWRREEELVGWERLDAVQLEEQAFMSINIRKIKLSYDSTKSLDLSVGILDEPFAAMKALGRVVPGKMDEKFKSYLGSDEERKVVKYPLPEGSGRNWAWVMPVFMQFLITVMIGTFGWSMFVGGRWVGAAFFGGFMLIMSAFFYGLLLMTDGQAQKELVKRKAAAAETGVAFPATLVTRLTRQTRPVVPYSEIRSIRPALEPMFFSHQAEFETFNGERFRVPYHVYESASRRREFFHDYFEYVNKGPALPAPKVLPRSLTGTLGLFVLFCSPVLLAPLVNIDLAGVMDIAMPLMILVVFAVLLPLLSMAMSVMSKRQKLGEGLVATSDRITLTGAPGKFAEIPRSELVSARIARDIWTLHCEIVTVKGRIKVGHLAAEKLLSAGYQVEGGASLTPLSSLAPARPSGAAPAGERPGRAASGERPGHAAPVDRPGHEHLGPGKLLAEQDPGSVLGQKRKFYAWGVPMTVLGVALLAVPFLVEVDTLSMLYILIFLMIPLIIGPVLVFAASKLRPARIHENGLVLPDGNRREGEVFVPYGRVKGYADLAAPLVGDVVRLQIEGGFYTLPKSFPGFNLLFEDMKKKFGKPEYDSTDFRQYTERTFKRLEAALYALALVFGYGGAVAFAVMWGFLLPASLLGKTLLYGTPLSLLVLAYALHFLESRKHNMPGRADLRKAGALVAAALVLFGAGWAVNIPDPDRTTVYTSDPPGSWATLNGSVEDRTLEMRENVSVRPGERLVIRNSTLCFQLTRLREFQFIVSKGGSLEVTDSLVRSNSSEFGLKFVIRGSAVLRNSTFTGLYASPWHNNGVGGLEIFSSDVSVVNCSIVDNPSNGLLILRSSPLIERCNISGNGDDGIEMQDASPVIRDCTIARNGWAMVINPYCRGRIERNLFMDNDHGIVIEGSSPVVANNTFSGNRNYAVKWYDNCAPTFENNRLEGNEAGIVGEMAMESYFSACAALFTVIGVVACGAVVAGIVRKRRTADAGKP